MNFFPNSVLDKTFSAVLDSILPFGTFFINSYTPCLVVWKSNDPVTESPSNITVVHGGGRRGLVRTTDTLNESGGGEYALVELE